MFCVKISADDAEFSFDKMTVVGLLFGIFVFMFHGLPYPGAERITGLRIVQNAQQPLPLCAENGLIGIGDELARDDCYRPSDVTANGTSETGAVFAGSAP